MLVSEVYVHRNSAALWWLLGCTVSSYFVVYIIIARVFVFLRFAEERYKAK